MIYISDELRERYRHTAEMIHVSRGDNKTAINQKAKNAIDVMRESLPNLDDTAIFTILSSVAYMLSTIMVAPMVNAGEAIEDLFDAYTLASASLVEVVDLADETAPVSEAEIEKQALIREIERLRAELAKPAERPSSNDGTGLYL